MYDRSCAKPDKDFHHPIERAFLRSRLQEQDNAREKARCIGRALIGDFRAEVQRTLGEFGISEHSYSVVVLDVSFRRSRSNDTSPRVFALVELRDSNLNPMIIHGNTIESFVYGPTAYLLSYDGKVRAAQPIFTTTTAKEAVRSMEDTLEDGGIKRLRRPIRSSIVFSLICDAIAKDVNGTNYLADKVVASISAQPAMLGTASTHEEIASSVRRISQIVSPRGIATYLVKCRLEGEIREFAVRLKRDYKCGTLSAAVVQSER
jgi:hypothetical protein